MEVNGATNSNITDKSLQKDRGKSRNKKTPQFGTCGVLGKT